MSPAIRKPLIVLAVLACAGAGWAAVDWYASIPIGRKAAYVGRQSCVECHQPQADAFASSHHDLAMDPANDETVLAKFDGQEITHHGVTSRAFERDGKYYIHTDGPDGALGDFEVKYVFGVTPLQQYLAEPTPLNEAGNDDGAAASGALPRLQVLPLAWDVPQQRWYFVNPDEQAVPGDPLHWTGWAQTWNHMCADCHSTNLHKNFDLAESQYHTTFSEIDVSCEACHGPGEIHNELANSGSLFWDRNHGYGLAKLKDEKSIPQLHTCAPCHSRRDMIMPDFRPGDNFFDHYRLTLLDEHLYYPDGQIQDEVYVFGSFLQSRMYRENVRCTDCHDPHSAKLLRTGNALCTKCHEPAKYDAPVHHHHQLGSTGASCVECHMPDRAYMGIDRRRDHSIRMPRPDVSVLLGTPNACTGCHLDEKLATQADGYPALLDAAERGDAEAKEQLTQLDRWAAEQIVNWYGPTRPEGEHFGVAIAAARRGDPDAVDGLLRIVRQPNRHGPIVRATAATHLASYTEREAQQALRTLTKDADGLVRAAAAIGLAPPGDAGTLSNLLDDPVRLVRDSAARSVLANPGWTPDQETRKAIEFAVEELAQGRKAHMDLAGAHMDFALVNEFYARRDRDSARLRSAMDSYRTALRLQPEIPGPRSNLAILHEELGEQDKALELWQGELARVGEAIELRPDDAGLRYQQSSLLYKLGQVEKATEAALAACRLAPYSARFRLFHSLLLIRRAQWDEAFSSTGELLKLEPDNPMWLHQAGLLLYRAGRIEQAEQALAKAAQLGQGGDLFSLTHTILLAEKHGQTTKAMELAQRLLSSDPSNTLYQAVLARVAGRQE